MKVFKFGGASVNSAEAVKNVASILKSYENQKLLVIISAMGKTTNMLEDVLNAFWEKSQEIGAFFDKVKLFHFTILNDLFPDKSNIVYAKTEELFNCLQNTLNKENTLSYDFEYDQIVSFGELISTFIVSSYLNYENIKTHLLDVREIIQTDDNYRDANVNWAQTEQNVSEQLYPLFKNGNIVLTQGFLGRALQTYTTTLGREGSDYSAAIFAHCLNAKEVVIWKDVEGLYNADPKNFSNAQKFEQIPYKEAIELAYYGATIIHPKTIKPLENKQIPLFVKSFLHPKNQGSIIGNTKILQPQIPSYIFKSKQILLSISSKDFSFIAENNLSEIFDIFARLGIKMNVMQNSAISFSACIDENKQKFAALTTELQQKFIVKYNSDLQLVTIRYYTQNTIDEIIQNKKVLLEQRSRLTTQIVCS